MATDDFTRDFEHHREHLRRVALRMLGTAGEADDAVQEAWLRASAADRTDVENLGGWLTTIVARVCLDLLRAKEARREDGSAALPERTIETEPELVLADSLGPALLVILDALPPAERVAFVLHDMFDLTFDEIAPIVGRTPLATRQLASRGRRRVQGRSGAPEADARKRRELVSAFLAASKEGNLTSLLAVLAPDAVVRADSLAVRVAAAVGENAPKLGSEIRGAAAVANVFKGRAAGAVPAVIDGEPGAVWAVDGRVRAAFLFTVRQGLVSAIDLVMEPEQLRELEISFEG